MKKILTLALALTIGMVSIQSCSSTMGSTSSSTGTTILTNILSTVLSMFGSSGTQGLAYTAPTASTSLSSILTSPAAVSAFKNNLSTKFQIPMDKINSAYSGMKTVSDVTNFVNKNGNPAILNSLK